MALLYPESHKMAVRTPGPDDIALSKRAMLAVQLGYGFALLHGDDQAMVHTIAADGWAVGDTGKAGSKVEQGHARYPVIRYCIGSADRCWLWSLREFFADPIACLERVADYYTRYGYVQKG